MSNVHMTQSEGIYFTIYID